MESIFLVSEAVASLGLSMSEPHGSHHFLCQQGELAGDTTSIDPSVITAAVWASEKLHPEVLSSKGRIQFLCSVREDCKKEGGDSVSVIFATSLKQKSRQISMV